MGLVYQSHISNERWDIVNSSRVGPAQRTRDAESKLSL